MTMAQAVTATKRLAAVTAVGVLLAGAAVVAAASTASAAPSISVDCSTTNLQTAIDNAASGATLVVTGTCFGNFTIAKNLTLLGQGTAVLDGQNAGTTLTVAQGATVVLTRLRISDGHYQVFPLFGSGGIDNHGTLTLNDSTVSDNIGVAGAIGNSGALTLNDSAVNHNGAFEGGGGINNIGTLTLHHSTVSDNTGGGIATGGFENGATVAVALYDSTVRDNVGTGIFQDAEPAFGTVTLNDSAVSHNTTGGIDNEQGAVTLRNSTISDNTNDGNGGGISNSGTLTLYDSTISGNTASLGGGIANFGLLTLYDSTVTGNTAVGNFLYPGEFGGGIYGLAVTLRDSTVSGNTPDNCEPLGSVAGCSG